MDVLAVHRLPHGRRHQRLRRRRPVQRHELRAGHDLSSPPAAHTVVLVEGESDRLALEALAGRLGRDLESEGVAVLATGGAKNLTSFVERYGPRGAGLRIAGLVDAAEADDARRALDRAGLGADLESRGFFVCDRDLEDELIRGLGEERVQAIIQAEEPGRWRIFRKQPEKRGQAPAELFRRFISARSGAKARYAGRFVDELDLTRLPPPLARVLAYTERPGREKA